jgi:hypothetical protein
VSSVPIQVPAAARARWLAELSYALDQTRDIMTRLDLNGGQRTEAIELFFRIEAARLEVQSLRLSRSLQPRRNTDPNWTGSVPWDDAEPRCG